MGVFKDRAVPCMTRADPQDDGCLETIALRNRRAFDRNVSLLSKYSKLGVTQRGSHNKAPPLQPAQTAIFRVGSYWMSPTSQNRNYRTKVELLYVLLGRWLGGYLTQLSLVE